MDLGKGGKKGTKSGLTELENRFAKIALVGRSADRCENSEQLPRGDSGEVRGTNTLLSSKGYSSSKEEGEVVTKKKDHGRRLHPEM